MEALTFDGKPDTEVSNIPNNEGQRRRTRRSIFSRKRSEIALHLRDQCRSIQNNAHYTKTEKLSAILELCGDYSMRNLESNYEGNIASKSLSAITDSVTEIIEQLKLSNEMHKLTETPATSGFCGTESSIEADEAVVNQCTDAIPLLEKEYRAWRKVIGETRKELRQKQKKYEDGDLGFPSNTTLSKESQSFLAALPDYTKYLGELEQLENRLDAISIGYKRCLQGYHNILQQHKWTEDVSVQMMKQKQRTRSPKELIKILMASSTK